MPQRYVYSREKALKGWNTRLQWIKSGTQSRAMDVPYEIYEKRYGPDLLSAGTVDIDLTLRFGAQLRNIIRRRRFQPDHLIGATATAVVGRDIDTVQKARRAYRVSGRKATMHTRRYRVANTNSLLADLQEKLDHLAQLPSKPSWLVAIDVTIYFNEGEEDLIKMTGKLEVYDR